MNRRRRPLPVLILTAALAAVAVPSCAASTPAPTPQPSQSPAPISADVGEELTSAGWVLTVDKVTFDASDEVASSNEFNPPPKAGHQYALLDLSVTRTGTPRNGLDLDITMGVDGELITPAPASPPAPLHLLSEFTPGQPVTGQLAFLVPEGTETAAVHIALGPANSFTIGAP